MAQIYLRAASTDNILILNNRESMLEPMTVPSFTDIRVGFLLSITDKTNNDLPNGAFAEDISGASQPSNYFWIGLKDTSTYLPLTGSAQFIGYTNAPQAFGTDHSQVVSSDLGIGTTNSNFWRPNNSLNSSAAFQINAFGSVHRISLDGIQCHFPQSLAGAGGYAVLLMFRVLNVGPSVWTVQVPNMGAHSSDVIFTNTPTATLLLQYLQAPPGTFQTLGPSGLQPQLFYTIPALFAYWPFALSRLRISAMGVFKAG